MPKTDEPGRQVKGTLTGYYLWAFDRVKEDQGGETGALNYIVGRWLMVDRNEALAEFDISREKYRNAKQRND
jgi:hypothetical protein